MTPNKPNSPSRRDFLNTVAIGIGAAAAASTVGCQQVGTPSTVNVATPSPAPAAEPPKAAKRTASDQVALGNTGLKMSRLGLGLGSNNGQIQMAAGQEAFNKFIKHAYDQGITMFDTAQAYRTFNFLGAAIKDLPRDKILIQSKIDLPTNNVDNIKVLNTIDSHRKMFNTDYVDSMLIHIQYRDNWTDTYKRVMDDYRTAQEKQWIKSRGVSCHSLPALRASVATDWTQVHLVRVNPQGIRIDNEQQTSWGGGNNDVKPVVAELKKIKEMKRGVIGMKIFGNGEFRGGDADREKSMQFAMSLPEIDGVIIGFANIEQFDKGFKLMNKVLAEAA